MSVTAVPLHPLTKGTIAKLWIGILLAVLIGVGAAWLGTSRLQYSAGEKGARYRVFTAGTGEPLGKDDLALMHVEMLGPKGQVIQSSKDLVDTRSRMPRVGSPQPATLEDLSGPLAALKPHIREGGSYQVLVPATEVLGPNLPPELKPTDELEYRLQVVAIERNGISRARALQQQQMQQQMMEQQLMQEMQRQGGGPGAAPGGAPTAGRPRPGGR